METEHQQEDYDYYNRRLQEELDNLNMDFQRLKDLAFESFMAYLSAAAERIGIALDKLLELFGPLFHD